MVATAVQLPSSIVSNHEPSSRSHAALKVFILSFRGHHCTANQLEESSELERLKNFLRSKSTQRFVVFCRSDTLIILNVERATGK